MATPLSNPCKSLRLPQTLLPDILPHEPLLPEEVILTYYKDYSAIRGPSEDNIGYHDLPPTSEDLSRPPNYSCAPERDRNGNAPPEPSPVTSTPIATSSTYGYYLTMDNSDDAEEVFMAFKKGTAAKKQQPRKTTTAHVHLEPRAPPPKARPQASPNTLVDPCTSVGWSEENLAYGTQQP